MGRRGHRYFGVDESGTNPMVIVAAYSGKKEDAQKSRKKIGKQRADRYSLQPGENSFRYARLESPGSSIDLDTRIDAICDLAMQCGFAEEDHLLVDAFGYGDRIKERIRQGLEARGVHVNGTLMVEHDMDRRYPIVNRADRIAYFLNMGRAVEDFPDRQIELMPQDYGYWQTYKIA